MVIEGNLTNFNILGLRMPDVEERLMYDTTHKKVYLAILRKETIGFETDLLRPLSMAWLRENYDGTWYQMSCWYDCVSSNWDGFCIGKTDKSWTECLHSDNFEEVNEFLKQEYPEHYLALNKIWG
jgi:hypothetical protein